MRWLTGFLPTSHSHPSPDPNPDPPTAKSCASKYQNNVYGNGNGNGNGTSAANSMSDSDKRNEKLLGIQHEIQSQNYHRLADKEITSTKVKKDQNNKTIKFCFRQCGRDQRKDFDRGRSWKCDLGADSKSSASVSVKAATQSVLDLIGQNCLICEKFSDDGNPLCPLCHVEIIYSKEYFDVFSCSKCLCQRSSPTSVSVSPAMTEEDSCCLCDCHGTEEISLSNWTSPSQMFQETVQLSWKLKTFSPPALQQHSSAHNLNNGRVGGENEDDASGSNLAALNFPPEILCRIFESLDEVTLLRASQVNSRWDRLITEHYSEEFWKQLFLQRLRVSSFSCQHSQSGKNQGKTNHQSIQSWKNVYAKILDSVACTTCFLNVTSDCVPVPNFNNNPGITREPRLEKELMAILLHKMEGIEAMPLDEVKYNWLARLEGPPSSPYAGGVFYLNLKFPKNYPFQPCQGRFLTKIFHPNVDLHGDIQMKEFQNRFSTPADTIRSVLLSIRELLQHPDVSSTSDDGFDFDMDTDHDHVPVTTEENEQRKMVDIQRHVMALYVHDPQSFNHIAMQWTHKLASSPF